jgi:hypothetical protein
VAGIDGLEQAFAFERVGEGELDLGGARVGRDDLGEPFRVRLAVVDDLVTEAWGLS